MLLVALVAVISACYADEVPPPDYILHGTCGTPENPNPAPLVSTTPASPGNHEQLFNLQSIAPNYD